MRIIQWRNFTPNLSSTGGKNFKKEPKQPLCRGCLRSKNNHWLVHFCQTAGRDLDPFAPVAAGWEMTMWEQKLWSQREVFVSIWSRVQMSWLLLCFTGVSDLKVFVLLLEQNVHQWHSFMFVILQWTEVNSFLRSHCCKKCAQVMWFTLVFVFLQRRIRSSFVLFHYVHHRKEKKNIFTFLIKQNYSTS